MIYNNALAVMSQRLIRHECLHQPVKIFRFETGEWDRCFKLVYLKKDGDGAASSPRKAVPGMENLRTVLERCRTLDLSGEIPACILKNDV